MTESAPEYRQMAFVRAPGSTSVILVRHGESMPARADTPFSLVDGHGDPALHPDGVVQAQKVGERLSRPIFGDPIAAIYVTNLQRTAQTAAPLATRLGIEPQVEADLREVHLGEWEGGLYRIRIGEGDPIAERMFEEERWDVIPGAEREDDFSARVTAGIDRIVAAHPDQVVALFTHGGVIGRILSLAAQSRPFAFTGAANASISHLVVGAEGRRTIRSYNDTAHLE